MVEDYLVNRLKWNLDDWELISSSTSERLGGRIDHNFEWKRTDFEAGESELRVAVGIQGEHIGSYSYWLKTPEAFWREFQEKADLAQAILTIISSVADEQKAFEPGIYHYSNEGAISWFDFSNFICYFY